MTATQAQEKGREGVGKGQKQHGGASWYYRGPGRLTRVLSVRKRNQL